MRDKNNNGLNNDEQNQPKNNKKSAPNFNNKAFTGEEDMQDEQQQEDQQQPQDEQQDDLSELIKKCKIDLSEILPPPPVAMEIMSEGKPIILFTKGNFSIITGKPKSRKSFFDSMLMATAIKGDYGNVFTCADKGMNILFDTEQSRYKSQQIAKRICRMVGDCNPDNFITYSLRTLDPVQRMELIDRVLATIPNINFVAIDGIIDLDIDPIMEAKHAQNIIHKLMQWTEIYNIHITCVLHYNKTADTLLGHLGSFSHRKSDAVIEISKNKDDESISLVKCLDAREKEFKPFAFSVDETGIPYILEDYEIQGKSTKKQKTEKVKLEAFTAYSCTSDNHNNILEIVYRNGKEYIYKDTWRLIKDAVMQVMGKSIGNTMSQGFFTYYESKGYLKKVTQGKRYPVYSLADVVVPDYENPVL